MEHDIPSTRAELSPPGQDELTRYLFFAEDITPLMGGFTDEYIEQLLSLFLNEREVLVETARSKLAARGIVGKLLDAIGPSVADLEIIWITRLDRCVEKLRGELMARKGAPVQKSDPSGSIIEEIYRKLDAVYAEVCP